MQISPLNGDTLTTTSALLDWNAVAQVQTYTVKIDTTLLFNSPLLKSYTSNYINANDTNPDTQKQLSGLLLGKTYYWTVKCTNTFGSSPWSPVWLFKTPSTSVINTIVDDDEFILYPQPAAEFVYLLAPLKDGTAVSAVMLNMEGQIIKNISFKYIHNTKISIAGLNKGIYIIRIIAGGREANKKLIID